MSRSRGYSAGAGAGSAGAASVGAASAGGASAGGASAGGASAGRASAGGASAGGASAGASAGAGAGSGAGAGAGSAGGGGGGVGSTGAGGGLCSLGGAGGGWFIFFSARRLASSRCLSVISMPGMSSTTVSSMSSPMSLNLSFSLIRSSAAGRSVSSECRHASRHAWHTSLPGCRSRPGRACFVR